MQPTINKNKEAAMRIRKAVIPAAGLGTRFLPATKAQAKEMLPIVDKPAIQFIVEEAVASGVDTIIIITGRTKKSIEDHFDRSVELELELERNGQTEMLEAVRKIANLADIYYIRQQAPLGLGHAVYCANHFIGNEPFAVLLGDDIVYNPTKPALRQLIEVYANTGSSVLGVQTVPDALVSRYGIVDPAGPFTGNFCKVRDLVEKPSLDVAPSNIAILGRYIITPEIFSMLKNATPGVKGEVQLTDALRSLLTTQNIYACRFEGIRYDIGDKLGYLAATVEYALRHETLSPSFSRYLAAVSLDKNLPVHDAISAELKRRKTMQETD